MSMLENYIEVQILVRDEAQLAAVYALLGGASLPAVAAGNVSAPVKQAIAAPSGQSVNGGEPLLDTTSSTATTVASLFEPDVGAPDLDAAGWPWSVDLHASTKGTTKDGLWRMKIGVTRPDPKPGFPKDTGTAAATSQTSASASPAIEPEPVPAVTMEEDDEFAAFRDAAAKTDAEDASAAASVPARKWTDADLGALCNQAAVKLGDPLPVKTLIAEYVPEGEVPHSRNIPVDQREAFAAAVEAKAGIEFTG